MLRVDTSKHAVCLVSEFFLRLLCWLMYESFAHIWFHG